MDDPRRFATLSYPHSQLAEDLVLMYEELQCFSSVARYRYIAAASLVNGPALEVNQSLRNLTQAEHSVNAVLPPYLKLGSKGNGAANKDTQQLVAEYNLRKEELEQKARDFKPTT